MLKRQCNKLWPIRRKEGLRFSLICSLGFFIAINYFLLRNLRDTVIATHPVLGVEAIPLLKLWVVLPALFLLTLGYKKWSCWIGQSTLFRGAVLIVTGYFLLFAFFLQESAPTPPLPFLPKILYYWPHSLFYLFSELWGTAVMLILYWGLLNRITPTEQAKRFYGPLLFICNFASIVSGKGALFLQQSIGPNAPWSELLKSYSLTIFLIALLILTIHFMVAKADTPENDHTFSSSSPSPSSSSPCPSPFPYQEASWSTIPLAATVFCYYFCSSMMEILWHYHLRELCPTPQEFNRYLSQVAIIIGYGTTFGSLLFTTTLLHRMSWNKLLLVPPFLLACVLLLFLNLSDLKQSVFLGATYHVLSRTLKFVIFDPAKELAFTTQSREKQIQTKPLIDGIAPHLGKSTESLLLSACVAAGGSFMAFFPLLAMLLLLSKLCWCWCAKQIDKKTHALQTV